MAAKEDARSGAARKKASTKTATAPAAKRSAATKSGTKKSAAKKTAVKKAPTSKATSARRPGPAGGAPSGAATAAHEAYLAKLPPERAAALRAVREAIRKGMPAGYEEGMQYGMIAWYVPHSRYPGGYHCDPKQPVPFASIASQKNHMGLYLMCIYGDDNHREQFIREWNASGKKLDMGKACVRFKRIEDVPLDVVTRAIARVPLDQFLAHYEASIPPSKRRR